MFDEKAFREAIAYGREQRGVEFKGPGSSSDKAFLLKIVRAMIGMANKNDGGVVLVGVEDETLILKGLNKDQLETWTYDDVASRVKEYADPYIDFDLTKLEVDKLWVVAIEVQAFDDLPVICCKEGPELRRGALYVRRRGGKIETVEVPSHVEMREVIERAGMLMARRILRSSLDIYEEFKNVSEKEKQSQNEFDNELKDIK